MLSHQLFPAFTFTQKWLPFFPSHGIPYAFVMAIHQSKTTLALLNNQLCIVS